jgi:hypothetical protein
MMSQANPPPANNTLVVSMNRLFIVSSQMVERCARSRRIIPKLMAKLEEPLPGASSDESAAQVHFRF